MGIRTMTLGLAMGAVALGCGDDTGSTATETVWMTAADGGLAPSLDAGALAAAGQAPGDCSAQAQVLASSQETLARTLGADSPTDALARYIAESQSAPVSDEVLELARLHLLDTLAAMVANGHLKPAQVARAYALAQGGGTGPATLLPTAATTQLLPAIFANAMTGHASEINDFQPSAFVQPGPAIVAVALAIGQARGSSGAQVLRAIVAGYELAGRVARGLGNTSLKNGGLASHSVGVTFGAAATAASLLGLSEAQTRFVLAYAAQQAAGSWNWLRDVEHVEKAFVFAGMPAQSGAAAALMVEAGFTGVDDPFHGYPNFLLRDAFVGDDSDTDIRSMIAGLGADFELPAVGFKRYPVGGPLQAAVEAMLELSPQVDPAQVDSVLVELPELSSNFQTAEMPALNLPYLMALVLQERALDFDLAQSRSRMQSESIRTLMDRVELRDDPSLQREPRVESARVTLSLTDGTTRTQFVEHVRGYPEYPMTADDVEGKARSLVEPHLGAAATDAFIERARSVESLAQVGELVTGLVRDLP